MFTVKADKADQLLTITFSKVVTAQNAKASTERVEEYLAEMEPGFRLLTDLTDLESMETDAATSIKRSMDLCEEKGISMVVRVIPNPEKDIGFHLMSLFHYSRSVRLVTCESMEAAEKVLAG